MLDTSAGVGQVILGACGCIPAVVYKQKLLQGQDVGNEMMRLILGEFENDVVLTKLQTLHCWLTFRT